MQETWVFDLLPSNDLPNEAVLAELIETKAKEVGIYLSYYYRPEGGLVEQVSLKDDIMFKTPITGSLKVEFDVIYYNACLNINSADNKDEMLLHFDINPEQQKVTFTGPYWPQREPDGL